MSFLDMKIHIRADHKLSATLTILHFHISLNQMQRKHCFLTIPKIEPFHYRWHPTTKRTGFSHNISPCQKIPFRNYHTKHFQNPPPLLWHTLLHRTPKASSSRTVLPIVTLHLPEGRNFSKSVQDRWHILLKMTQLHSIWQNHPIPTYHKTGSLKVILVHFCQAKLTSIRSAPHKFCQQ